MKEYTISLRHTLQIYYEVTKPGIVRGNIITAVAGFLFASLGVINWSAFFGVVCGVMLVIAAGCIFNNFIDRDIDARMERTKNRAFVTGDIPTVTGLLYAVSLAIIGFGILAWLTNMVTVIIGLIAFVSYVVAYDYAKRKTVYGTLVGTVPGALSLVAGYTTVVGSFDKTALLLFLSMVFWQMPHFYAIAIYRRKDYAAAKLPVITVKKGIAATKVRIVLYIVAFGITGTLLSFLSYAGIVYLIGITALSVFWLSYALKGYSSANDESWARGIFGISLVVLLGFSLLLALNSYIP